MIAAKIHGIGSQTELSLYNDIEELVDDLEKWAELSLWLNEPGIGGETYEDHEEECNLNLN